MIQKKKKQIKLAILVVIIVGLLAGGTVWFATSRNTNMQITANNDKIIQRDFSSKRLIVTTDIELKETFNSKSVNKLPSGKYVIKYETEEDTKNAYEKFVNNKDIKSVEIDAIVKLQEVAKTMTMTYDMGGRQTESWGVYTMGLNETQSKINSNTTKENIVVAVIDTGFDLTNSSLNQNNLRDRIDNRYKNVAQNSTDITDRAETVDGALYGHGTHTGGIILDCTPSNVKILPIKAEDDEGTTSLAYVYDAMRYAIDQNVDVINLSLGWTGTSTVEMKRIFQEANDKGIVVVAAVGNGDENGNRINGENIYPASYPNVMGVAALQTNKIERENGQIIGETYLEAKNSGKNDLTYTSFSNYGSMVDFAAPGKDILVLLPTGSEQCCIADGTSHACPHIAAAAATIKSYEKEFTADEVYDALCYYAIDLGVSGKDTDYGEGMPCFKDFSECNCGCNDCDVVFCSGCSCEDCKFHEGAVKVVTKIEITKTPTKTTYTEGEVFDPTGMEVTATYSDNSQEIVTDYTYTPTEALTTTTTSITVKYKGKTANLNITVTPEEPPAKTLEKIEITKSPTKTTYTEGEVFDPTGMEVTATYSDNSQEIVTDYTYTPTEALTTTTTSITVKYKGKTANLNITVTPEEPPAKTLEKIEITKSPTKTTYTEGEVFDPTGMEVTATYSDNSQEIVTNYTYTPTEALTTTTTLITVKYEGKTANLNITVTPKEVPAKTLVKIEVTKNPDKVKYIEGEKFNKTGMEVTAIYSDGSSKVINNYNCFPITELSTSNSTITISYTENGKTVTATLPIEVRAKNTNNNDKNDTNKDVTNENANNSTNIIQIKDKNTDVNSNKITKDNTTKDGKIASTGGETYIIPIIVIAVIGAFGFVKYRQYKDI